MHEPAHLLRPIDGEPDVEAIASVLTRLDDKDVALEGLVERRIGPGPGANAQRQEQHKASNVQLALQSSIPEKRNSGTDTLASPFTSGNGEMQNNTPSIR